MTDKQDLINSLNAYIEVLEFDKRASQDQTQAQILRNVIISLKDIIKRNS